MATAVINDDFTEQRISRKTKACSMIIGGHTVDDMLDSTPLNPAVSRITAFRKELDMLRDSVSDRRHSSVFSPPSTDDDALSMIDEFTTPPCQHPPPAPLPVDEPFKILSSDDHIVLPMEEYSIQVPAIQTTPHSSQQIREKIDREFSLSEFEFTDNENDDEQKSSTNVRFTRQKSLEYDHLEDESAAKQRSTSSDNNNNYTVTVQFHADDVSSIHSVDRGVCHCPVCCSCGSSHKLLCEGQRERKLSQQLQRKHHHECYETLSNASWPACPIERYTTKLTQPMMAAVASKHFDKDHVFGSSVEISHSNSVIEDELEISSHNALYSDTQSLMSYQSGLTCNSHCSFNQPLVKGVDGSTFRDRMEMICQWYQEFNDHQRNSMIMRLLSLSNCSQMHMLSVEMEPILHQTCPHNCQDLLSWLPSSIAFRIMGFLDPVSLCRASQVSKLWYTIANDHLLWKRLTLSRNWQLSTEGHAKQLNMHSLPNGDVQWKIMFAERFRLRRNWLKGYCTVRTFEGHSQGISCVQFDDTRIVSGSWDKTIKVWNRRTNTAWAALTLSGHSGTVRCLHLHGNRLVSGSSDRTIKVWDLATNNVNWVGAACKATMIGHLHTVRCLEADDSKVVSGSYDHTLKIWDIKTGTCTKTLRGHTDAVLCLQFDNEKVISGSKDTTIKVWEFINGACKLTLHGHVGAVSCLQFDDDRLISGALDRLIKIWNLSTGQCVRTIDWIKSEGHTGVVRHLQADSWKLVSAADDKTLKVWSIHTGERLLTLRSHSDGVTCLQFNDQVIVSGSYDKTVKLWDFSVC